ncbi:hypothetical protein EDB92DRAFT_2102339 [Lactarius akahatsu]|uniref:DUF6534 domain-containing protein n=1 Tax=Lactarius akahatsu TaxID=416441 RepID=A0AAD4LJH4_9AGAM|nr:hypothetical protein EDB92DRAFT_2102339 [Lactarius akahatsu]
MPAQIPVDNVLGVFFIGVIFSSILYGVIWLQVYSYFSQHCKEDGIFLKCFVASLLILDSLQLALVVHGFYVAGITNFGDYLADLSPPWSLKVQTLLTVIVTCSVQQFYAWRIYHLSMGQIYAPAFIVVLSLAELGLEIVYLVRWQVTSQLLFLFVLLLILHFSFQYPYYDQAKVQIPNLTAGLSIQVACDLTITTSMIYYLLSRHETVVKRANPTITTVLALYCVNSGALTLVFAIIGLATFVRFTHTLIFAPFFFILVRLYPCAFMAILNSRSRLRTSLNAEVEKGTVISFFHGTSTLSHVEGSDVVSAGASASTSTTDAIGLRFATQGTISSVSRTKMSTLRFAESDWRGLGEVDDGPIDMESHIANYDEADSIRHTHPQGVGARSACAVLTDSASMLENYAVVTPTDNAALSSKEFISLVDAGPKCSGSRKSGTIALFTTISIRRLA